MPKNANKAERRYQQMIRRDKQAKARGELVGRYIREIQGEGYAYYEIVKVNKRTARIKLITGIGQEDRKLPMFGEQCGVRLEYIRRNLYIRDSFEAYFAAT